MFRGRKVALAEVLQLRRESGDRLELPSSRALVDVETLDFWEVSCVRESAEQ